MNQHLIFSTPMGSSAIVYREEPFVLIQTILPCEEKELSLILDSGARGSHPIALALSKAVMDYFNGKKIPIPWAILEWGRRTELQKTVLKAVAAIPYGEVKTYQEVAHMVGRPKACRFVGNTLAQNPFPILIPCHRVIRSNGSVGQFGGGSNMKQQLLDLESKFWAKKS